MLTRFISSRSIITANGTSLPQELLQINRWWRRVFQRTYAAIAWNSVLEPYPDRMQVYLKFERLRACHNNMLENMSFLVGGILAGIMAQLPADFMHQMSLVILVSRAIYLISYTSVTSSRWAPLRTVWFLTSNLAVMAIYWKAGMILVREGKLP